MQLGFIGLGHMGFPIARRLLQAGHAVVAFDTRNDALDRLVGHGAQRAASAKDVGDRAETVLASLPSPEASLAVATGADGLIEGTSVRRFVDFSTVGAGTAQRIQQRLARRGIAAIDSPVSGGIAGARHGTLALMVSGARRDFDLVAPVLDAVGTVFYVGEAPGSGQSMKLVNNMLAATGLIATCEAVVMGVKAGLDPRVMIDVLNAGSGATHASRDKFPRSILPRTFDFGFATGLMVKDVRLYLEEAQALGVPTEVMAAVGQAWENVISVLGPDCDFTAAIQPLEQAAGVIVRPAE